MACSAPCSSRMLAIACSRVGLWSAQCDAADENGTNGPPADGRPVNGSRGTTEIDSGRIEIVEWYRCDSCGKRLTADEFAESGGTCGVPGCGSSSFTKASASIPKGDGGPLRSDLGLPPEG